MKKQITLKQWDKITKEQKNILWDSGFQKDWKMNIGDMIEFLGDDIVINKEKNKKWILTTEYDFWENSGWNWKESEQLVDALWKVCKFNLKDL